MVSDLLSDKFNMPNTKPLAYAFHFMLMHTNAGSLFTRFALILMYPKFLKADNMSIDERHTHDTA